MQLKRGDILVCVSELTGYTIGLEYKVTVVDDHIVDKHIVIPHIWLMDDTTIYYGKKKFLQVGYSYPHMICWTEHFITKEQYIRNKKLEELVSNID